MAYRVILAPRAIKDLEAIVRYISVDSPAVAKRVGERLLAKARFSGAFPSSGRVVPELQDPIIRETVLPPYRIVYRVREDRQIVEIARFWHAARGIPELTADDT